ncbi:MAG: Uma2 family endonuclease [Pseudomonadota bacterium]|nr:Uma2 family endonuclease [Pseudomonadota bacterium]
MQTAEQFSLYDQLAALPENLTGEILNGQIHAQPRPAPRHARAASRLDRSIGRGYDDGDDGPGGWWILPEPEIHFVRKLEVVVPDLAGWKHERMPKLPETDYFETVPDWVCEVLSPSTASKDREVKMPIYAHYGVRHAWLVDPKARTLEALELRSGVWAEIGRFSGSDAVSIVPFDKIRIELATLWT